MQLDHCESDSIRGRVPTVYQTSVFLWFFSVLAFRRINKLRDISPHQEFDSHPGHHFFFALNKLRGVNLTSLRA